MICRYEQELAVRMCKAKKENRKRMLLLEAGAKAAGNQGQGFLKLFFNEQLNMNKSETSWVLSYNYILL